MLKPGSSFAVRGACYPVRRLNTLLCVPCVKYINECAMERPSLSIRIRICIYLMSETTWRIWMKFDIGVYANSCVINFAAIGLYVQKLTWKPTVCKVAKTASEKFASKIRVHLSPYNSVLYDICSWHSIIKWFKRKLTYFMFILRHWTELSGQSVRGSPGNWLP